MTLRRTGAHGVPLLAIALLVGAVALVGMPLASGDEEGGVRHAYETPEALVEALLTAAEANDDAAMKTLAGPESADLVQSGGDPTVAKSRAEFAANGREFWKLEDNEDESKTLVLGNHRWPFPIPLRKIDAGWALDVEAGRTEMLARRIGKNELDAIKLCRAFCRLQEEYAAKDRDGDRVKEYAQLVKSTPGQRDGLYWPTVEGEDLSPLGPAFASAAEFFKDRQGGEPFGGYYWRILKGQGRNAPGGCHHYVLNGNMVAGYALIGVPAEYRTSGVMTFLISKTGDVYEKDLGLNTPYYGKTTQWFDPDATWQIVED